MATNSSIQYTMPEGNKSSIGYINSDKAFSTTSDVTYGDTSYILSCKSDANGSTLYLDIGRRVVGGGAFIKRPQYLLDIPFRVITNSNTWSVNNSTYNSFFNPGLTSVPNTSLWVEANIPYYNITEFNNKNSYQIKTVMPLFFGLIGVTVGKTTISRILKIDVMQATMTIGAGTQYDDIYISYTYRASIQQSNHTDEKVYSCPGYAQFRFDKSLNRFVTNGVTMPSIPGIIVAGPLSWGVPKALNAPNDVINSDPAYSADFWNKRIIQGVTVEGKYITYSMGCLVDICHNSNINKAYVVSSQVGLRQTSTSVNFENKLSICAYNGVSTAYGYITPFRSRALAVETTRSTGALTFLQIETEHNSNTLCLTYSQTKETDANMSVSSVMRFFDGSSLSNREKVDINGEYSNLYTKPYDDGFLVMARDLVGNVYLGKWTVGQRPAVFQFKPSQRIISGLDPVAFINQVVDSGGNIIAASFIAAALTDINSNVNREGRDDTINLLSTLWSYDHFIRVANGILEVYVVSLSTLKKFSIAFPTTFDNYAIQTPNETNELKPYVPPTDTHVCDIKFSSTTIQTKYGDPPTTLANFLIPKRALQFGPTTYVGWWNQTGLEPDDKNGIVLPLIIDNCSGIARALPHPNGYKNLTNNSVEVPVSYDTLDFNPEYAGNAQLYQSTNGLGYYYFRVREPVIAHMVVWNPTDNSVIMDRQTNIYPANYTPTGFFSIIMDAYLDTTDLYDGSKYYTEDGFNLANIPYHIAIYNNKEQYLYYTGTFNLTPPGTSGSISAGDIKKTTSKEIDFNWERRLVDPYTDIHTVQLYKGDNDPVDLPAQYATNGKAAGVYKVSTDGLSLGDKVYISYIAARKGKKISTTNRYSDTVFYVKGHKYSISNVDLTIDGTAIPASSLKSGTLEITNVTGNPSTISIIFNMDNEGFDTSPYSEADVIPRIKTSYLMGTKIPLLDNRRFIPTRHPDFPTYSFRQTIPAGAYSTYPNINNLGISWLFKQPGFYVKKDYTTEVSLTNETLSASVQRSGTYKFFILIVDEFGSGSLFDITNPNNNYRIEFGA